MNEQGSQEQQSVLKMRTRNVRKLAVTEALSVYGHLKNTSHMA